MHTLTTGCQGKRDSDGAVAAGDFFLPESILTIKNTAKTSNPAS